MAAAKSDRTIELSPLQAVSLQATRVLAEQAGERIESLRSQAEQLQERANSLLAAAEQTRESTVAIREGILRQIALEHGVEAIPGQARIALEHGVTTISWGETDGAGGDA